MKKEIKSYLEKQPSPQKEICERLHTLIVQIFPDIQESMQYGVPYYGGKVYILALKDHVNLGFPIKDLTQPEIDKLQGTGKTVRYIPIASVTDIDKEKIGQYLRIVLH